MALELREKKYFCTYKNCRRPQLNLHEIFEHAAWYHCNASKEQREEGCFEFKCTDAVCGGYFVSSFFAQCHAAKYRHIVIPLIIPAGSRRHFKEAWKELNDIVDNCIVHKDIVHPNFCPLPVPPPHITTSDRALASRLGYSNNGCVTPTREKSLGGFYSPAYSRWNDLNRTPTGQKTPTRDRTPDWERTPTQNWTPVYSRTPDQDRPRRLIDIPESRVHARSSNAFNFAVNRTPDTFHHREQITQRLSEVQNEAPYESFASTGIDIADDNDGNTPLSPSAEEEYTPRSPAVSKEFTSRSPVSEEYTPRSPPILRPEPKIGPAPPSRKRNAAPLSQHFEMARAERTIPTAPKSKESKFEPFRIRHPTVINHREAVAIDQRDKTLSVLEKVSAAIDAKKLAKATNRYGGGSVESLVKTIDPIPISPEKEVKRRGRTPARGKTPPRSRRSKTPSRGSTPPSDGTPVRSRKSTTPGRRNIASSNEVSPVRSRRSKTPVKSHKNGSSRPRTHTATKSSRAARPISRDESLNRSRGPTPISPVAAKDSVWDISPIPYRNRLRDRTPSRPHEASGTGRLATPRRRRAEKSSSEDSLIYCGGATPLYQKTNSLTTSTPKTSGRSQRAVRSLICKENHRQGESSLNKDKEKHLQLSKALKLADREEKVEEKTISVKRELCGSPPKQIKVTPARKNSIRTTKESYLQNSSSPEPTKRRRLLSSSDSEQDIKPTITKRRTKP